MAKTEDPRAEAEKAAREYAWHWFEYHAAQRQTVFRFFLVLAGAVAGAWATVAKDAKDHPSWAFWLGVALMVLAFSFWRLDLRSRDLIEGAEEYLKKQEVDLKKALGEPDGNIAGTICIATNAHDKRKEDRARCWYEKGLYTFKQIYRLVFVAIGLVGLGIAFMDAKSPLKPLVAGLFGP